VMGMHGQTLTHTASISKLPSPKQNGSRVSALSVDVSIKVLKKVLTSVKHVVLCKSTFL
jgi:hypothetical protein